jgi:hypothetical protein
MASIRKEVVVRADPEAAWAALRDFGAPHRRLVPGFVVDTRLEGDERVVTFFNGAVAREQLVAVDDDARRVVYSVVESGLGITHHNASAQVVSVGEGQIKLVWIADVLPHEVAPVIGDLMERGTAAMRQALEQQ